MSLSAKIVILNNKKCHIEIDLDGVSMLYTHLSFKQEGIEYSPQYQNGYWNGVTYLFNKNKNTFDLGLLNNVSDFLKKNNYDVFIEDKRLSIGPIVSLDISDNLKALNMVPREHQERVVALVPENRKGIIRSATGSGKSLMIAMMTAKINRPTIIGVIGLDLLDQFHELFSKIFNEEIGYIGNGVCNIKRINIASIWSLGTAINCKKSIDDDELKKEKSLKTEQKELVINLLKNTECFFIDECHVASCNTLGAIYKKSNFNFLYGFSGTPFKGIEQDLLVTSILGSQLINISAGELIEKGLLVQPIIKFIDVPPKFLPGTPTYAETYSQYIIENEVRNKLIVKYTVDLVNKGYTPLVLFKNISHGKILYDLMEETGIAFEMLSGKDKLKTRDKIKKQIVSGEIKVILASTIFDIGIDISKLNALILAGGGKSYVRCLQRIGRVIRPYPNKKIAAIVEFYDQIRYLKGHAKKRFEIYKSETGFKVIKSSKMK